MPRCRRGPTATRGQRGVVRIVSRAARLMQQGGASAPAVRPLPAHLSCPTVPCTAAPPSRSVARTATARFRRAVRILTSASEGKAAPILALQRARSRGAASVLAHLLEQGCGHKRGCSSASETLPRITLSTLGIVASLPAPACDRAAACRRCGAAPGRRGRCLRLPGPWRPARPQRRACARSSAASALHRRPSHPSGPPIGRASGACTHATCAFPGRPGACGKCGLVRGSCRRAAPAAPRRTARTRLVPVKCTRRPVAPVAGWSVPPAPRAAGSAAGQPALHLAKSSRSQRQQSTAETARHSRAAMSGHHKRPHGR